jgi:ubiquinone/menaquinone biosynthesis C-methylase UbiE
VGRVLRALDFCREHFARVIQAGDVAVDATCGNGKDTLFLAECVGPGGKVFAFDIQEAAIRNTHDLIKEKGFLDRVSLHQENHENILHIVDVPVKAAMFNLGYLPGGDHGVITKPDTTIKALEGLFTLLLPGGLVSVIAYTGHPRGEEEKKLVQGFLEEVEQRQFSVLHYRFVNQINHPPQLFLIEKIF